MDLQRIATSSYGVKTALALARIVPPRIGLTIGNLAADWIASRKQSSMVQAVRINQWVIHNQNLSPKELQEVTNAVFRHAVRCFYDFFRSINVPDKLKQLSPETPESRRLVDRSKSGQDGAMIVAPHLSNFDLVLLANAYRGLQGQVLSYGQPTGGYEIQNQIRASTGLEITPVRGEITHQKAIEFMRNGGYVMTAVDRPIRNKKHYLNFFGRLSPLPTGHVRMAISAGVPVIVAAANYQPDEKYHLVLSEEIHMQSLPDPVKEIRANAELVLDIIARFILKSPEQWQMYYPVWPEVEEDLENF
jgi:KDO2-lipid IV(A) lauroyltransferase